MKLSLVATDTAVYGFLKFEFRANSFLIWYKIINFLFRFYVSFKTPFWNLKEYLNLICLIFILNFFFPQKIQQFYFSKIKLAGFSSYSIKKKRPKTMRYIQPLKSQSLSNSFITVTLFYLSLFAPMQPKSAQIVKEAVSIFFTRPQFFMWSLGNSGDSKYSG